MSKGVILGYNVSMTQISSDDVLALAQLSALQLDDSEVTSLQKDITNILGYVEQLGKLDTTGVEPTYQVTGLENIMREDVVAHDVVRDEILKLAPKSRDNQIEVPKVL